MEDLLFLIGFIIGNAYNKISSIISLWSWRIKNYKEFRRAEQYKQQLKNEKNRI
jgi:hypothetical protein